MFSNLLEIYIRRRRDNIALSFIYLHDCKGLCLQSIDSFQRKKCILWHTCRCHIVNCFLQITKKKKQQKNEPFRGHVFFLNDFIDNNKSIRPAPLPEMIYVKRLQLVSVKKQLY